MTRFLLPFLLLLVAFASSCAEPNAILELRLELPSVPSEEPRRYAFIQVRRAQEAPFEAFWSDSNDLDPVALHPSETTRDHMSVVNVGADDDFDLNVRVRFCIDPHCADLADNPMSGAPESCFTIEHPFYTGQRTSITLMIGDLPIGPCSTPDAVRVGPCEVQCLTRQDAPNCSEGRHSCE